MNLHKKLTGGAISVAFRDRGIYTFQDACAYIRALPYKRNSTKEDTLIVLKESCGTCSSKHELIKRLAQENAINNCALILCIFKMTGSNTQKVKPILENYNLEFIPEAHTYILLEGNICDLTFPENPELRYLNEVMYTEEINADQIGIYKVEKHRSFLDAWRKENDVAYSLEELWGIREKCIAALAT